MVAICYDFDRTLSPGEMQQGFIAAVGYGAEEFWREANGIAERNEMDKNLAYMYLMVKKAEGKFALTEALLNGYGSEIRLFKGVEEWFARICRFGKEKGVAVEHYVISSGLKEMIEGTEPARAGAFEKVYASSYCYGENGGAVWPAQVVNYTNKTQFLFRISKGVTEVNDDGVNDLFLPEDIRVPFTHMIYIGDSDTDVPCMKLVTSHGGNSIGVYNPASGDRRKVEKMLKDKRVKYIAPADYTEGGELDLLVKDIILKIICGS